MVVFLPAFADEQITIDAPNNIRITQNNGVVLLTLRVNNIQVRQEWSVQPDHLFTIDIDSGKINYLGGSPSQSTNIAITVMVKDKFRHLSGTYADLMAEAIINISLIPAEPAIYLMGGWYRDGSTNRARNDIWSSVDGENWIGRGNAEWAARGTHQVVAYNGKMYLFNGNDGSDLEDVWSSLGGSWMKLNNTPYGSRRDVQLVVHNDKIYSLGGGRAIDPLNDVWSWDGSTWTVETPNAQWPKRTVHQAVSYNGTLYVMGGIDDDLQRLSDVWSSVDGQNWQEVTVTWPSRDSFAAVVHNNNIYVMGGNRAGDTYANDVWSSADGKNWVQGNDATWEGRRSFVAISYKGRIYVMGGLKGSSSNTANYLNDVWSSADGQTWSLETATANWPGRRYFDAVVFP